MKVPALLATMLAAIVLQAALSRYLVADRWVVDLVLVGVVYCGLQLGPVAGMLGGTIGGVLQDLLAGTIVGVSGLAKTVVGFAAGAIGAQFALDRPRARMLVVAAASVVHRLFMTGLNGLIDQHWPGVSWTAILSETGLNALAGLLVFHATEALPAALERGRMSRRSTLSRRQW
jgi:rod shape-determining protein MreD